MATPIVGNIYRTNLSQPGGLVRVLEVVQSDYNLDGKACYIEHVEDHPYGYSQGTKGWYEDRDLVTVCQDCGEDLPEGESCQNCEMQRWAADEVQSWEYMGQPYRKSLIPDDYDLGGEPFDYDDDEDYVPDALDYDDDYDYIASERHKRIITCNGQVWDVSLVVYTTGYREVTRIQCEDTCWDGMIPF
jgi:hypothetical protein